MQYKPNYPNMDKLFPQHKIPKIESPTYEKGKSPIELLESQSAYLEKTSKELHDMAQCAKSQADSAKEIAESSKTQAELAIKESQKASKASVTSAVRANISTIVSVLSLILSVFINADKIIKTVQSFLSYLSQLGHWLILKEFHRQSLCLTWCLPFCNFPLSLHKFYECRLYPPLHLLSF